MSYHGESRRPDQLLSAFFDHYRFTTEVLLETTRRITNAEPAFSNACVRNAMAHLARTNELSWDDRNYADEIERAEFQLLLADLNCLKISIAGSLEQNNAICEYVIDDNGTLAPQTVDGIQVLKREAAAIIRRSSAEWDLALNPSRRLPQGGNASLEASRTALTETLSGSLRIYENLRDDYNIPENFALRRRIPHTAKKLFYASYKDSLFLFLAIATGAGVIGNVLYPLLAGLFSRLHLGSLLIGAAWAETNPNGPRRPATEIVSPFELTLLCGVFLVLLTCLYLVARKGTDKATNAWARDLIKIIVGFFVGHLTR